ncbi:MAG: lysylphosphatidylglycerol synthase transmembrane domain-containing protein [Acidimicrobiales bacterium]
MPPEHPADPPAVAAVAPNPMAPPAGSASGHPSGEVAVVVAVARSRWRRAWPVLRWVLAVLVVGLAAWVVSGQAGELSGAGKLLSGLRWPWAVVATIAEAASYLASAVLQQVLLRSGHLRAGLGRTSLIGLATSAIQNSLPAGAAFAGVFAFRQYRRMGAGELLAAWCVVAVTGCLFVGITAMAVLGLILGFGAGSALDLVQVLGGLGALAAALVIAWSRREWVFARAVGVLRFTQRRAGHPHGDPRLVVDQFRRRLGAVTPSRRHWGLALGAAVWTWGFDLLCLVFAFVAVGASLPWRGLLLAYSAAQLAATLPITPGGLGVVEGSLTVALVAFGGAEASAVAAVLVYRVISYWTEMPVGWLSSIAVGRLPTRAPLPIEVAAADAGDPGPLGDGIP